MQMKVSQSLWADLRTQTDLLRSKKAVQTFGSGELQNLEVTHGTEVDEGCHGCRCVQLDDLSEQLIRLIEEVTRLRCIQQPERETEAWYLTVAQAERQLCLQGHPEMGNK